MAVFSLSAAAQNLSVVPVPIVSNDLTTPHAAYNGHATTFKAIARGGNGTYLYEWDFDGDGTFDFSASTTNRYNLSTRFTYPVQTIDKTFTASVRVTSNGQTVTGSYRVHVFADVPANPSATTPRQLQVMRNVAIDDGLWFLHNQMIRSGNEADPVLGARATGSITNSSTMGEGTFLWALSANGHFVAFPPSYQGSMRDPASNAARFAGDPYAEDGFRLVNQLLSKAAVVSLPATDESNATGDPEVTATPIPGTDDGLGLYIGQSPGDQTTGQLAEAIRGLAVARLGGYLAQVGATQVLGRSLEFIIQQLVDALVWAQNDDSGIGGGSWYYTPNSLADLLGELGAGTMDCAEALWQAEQSMGSEGVIVPNLVKARLLQYIVRNANACPGGGTGGSFASSFNGVCDLALSAAHTTSLGWVGANRFSSSDNTAAFPGYNTLLRSDLRNLFDSSQIFIGHSVVPGSASTSIGWDTGFVDNGDFTRVDGHGNHWSMVHWARAARATDPEVILFGVYDWNRLFSGYLIRNQQSGGQWNWVLGSTNANNDTNAGEAIRAAWSIHTMTPDTMPPLVIISASPTLVTEGTEVSFAAVGSVSDPVTFAWMMGNVPRTGGNVSFAWPDDAVVSVSATATAQGGAVDTATVSVTVLNVPPAVDAGVDFTIPEGTAVTLSGSFFDPGVADTHTISWNFGDTQTSSLLSVSHVYGDNGVFTARLTVTDDDLGIGSDTAQVTVTNVAPTITSTPPTTALQGVPLTYTLTFTDPGQDTHSCSATTLPANASLTNCVFTWSPAVAQAGTSAPVVLCVTDDDLGQTCQSFQVAVTANQPPGVPRLDTPVAGAELTTFQPTLTVGNAVDPEGEMLTYEFELYFGPVRVGNEANIAETTGTTSWQVSTMLVEDTIYQWRARAVAPSSAGPWTELRAFSINTANRAPPPPTLISPTQGSVIDSATPTLVFLPWGDPDGSPLTFDWQVAGDESFNTVLEEGTGLTTTEVTITRPLAEDSRACWRVRASDSQAQSPWARACFRVSAVDGAPTVPVLLAPAEGAVVSALPPVFAWSAGVDPEGDALTYELEVTEGTTVVTSVTNLGGTATVLATPLVDGHSYTWKVRATAGATASAFSAPSSFTVTLPRAPEGGGSGTGGGNDGTGGGAQKPAGCGCAALPGTEFALLGTLLLFVRARRRA